MSPSARGSPSGLRPLSWPAEPAAHCITVRITTFKEAPHEDFDQLGIRADHSRPYSPGLSVGEWILLSYPSRPLRLDPEEPEALSSARFGEHVITSDDIVSADDDGVAFVPADRVDEVLDAARAIWQVEREQASRIAAGETLRAQTSFDEYLSRRAVPTGCARRSGVFAHNLSGEKEIRWRTTTSATTTSTVS